MRGAAEQAVDQHHLADCPFDRLDCLFGHAMLVAQQGEMRREPASGMRLLVERVAQPLLQDVETDHAVVAADLAPGGRFTTDAVWGQSGGFMFTACPPGTRPNLRFALENRQAIGVSLYNCVSGRPSS